MSCEGTSVVRKGFLTVFISPSVTNPFDRLVKFMGPVVDSLIQKWSQPYLGSHFFLKAYLFPTEWQSLCTLPTSLGGSLWLPQLTEESEVARDLEDKYLREYTYHDEKNKNSKSKLRKKR